MEQSKKSSGVVPLIGGFKLAKGVLLIALTFGALKFLHQDPRSLLQQLVSHLSVDPGSRYFQAVAQELSPWSQPAPLPVG